MRIVWERGEAAAEDVSEALGSRFKNATVRTVLRRVEQKGYLEHRREGRAFIYRPTVDAATAAEKAATILPRLRRSCGEDDGGQRNEHLHDCLPGWQENSLYNL